MRLQAKRPTRAWQPGTAGPGAGFSAVPTGAALPFRPWILATLLLACLLPRAVAAWNWDVLWSDSLHYLRASVALENGDLQKGFAELGLNLFPIILIPLRHMGTDWHVAGKLWSVLMATVTVLPLWGWARRQFDDRIAFAACLCYAFQGKLVAISPLIIRDSTFWFLFSLTLYCSWRAVTEGRLSMHLAAGAALTLAGYTRTEGWILVVPIIGWAAARWSVGSVSRLRLAGGAVLCLSVVPLSITALNLTWLRDCPRWELVRHRHLEIGKEWWQNQKAQSGPPALAETPSPAAAAGHPLGPAASAPTGARRGQPLRPRPWQTPRLWRRCSLRPWLRPQRSLRL